MSLQSKLSTTISFLVIICLVFIPGCKKTDVHSIDSDTEVATRWADLTLNTIRKSIFKSPTYASRTLGYMGVTMYESVVHSDATNRSLAGQLNGLANLPQPLPGSEYNWVLAMNAAEQTMLKLLIPGPDDLLAPDTQTIDAFYNDVLTQKSAGVSQATIDRSVQFGRDIANAIYAWSATDSGHNGFKKNFDPAYTFPHGPSYWTPPVAGQTVSAYPLHPHWGKNRTFVIADSSFPIPAIVPYSTDPSSEYYKLYKAVYDKNINLTNEEREIAAWWSDDPSETFSPPGHSYNLATITIKKSGAGLLKAAETYARVGIAVADAFINCWEVKVIYFNQRPSGYVRANINPAWTQYWPEPPFPAFPSGHSTQSAAAAVALEGLYGNNFSVTDNSHVGEHRAAFPDLKFNARNYSNFWATAEESAYSRFLGGIHTQQDNTVGLAEGKKIGENINKLSWKR